MKFEKSDFWWLILITFVGLGVYFLYADKKNTGNSPVNLTEILKNQGAENSKAAEDESSRDKLAKLFADYFPAKPGLSWTYKIEIGKVEPAYVQEVRWHADEDSLVISRVRGRYPSLIEDPNKKEFLLELAVEKAASEQCELTYPQGYKLKIIRDELGYYQDAVNVYWALSYSDGLQILEVTEIDPRNGISMLGPTFFSSSLKGCSLNMKLFSQTPGISISMDQENIDKLLFLGIEPVPTTKEKGLHFVRIIEQSEEDAHGSSTEAFGKKITEDMYFVKGIGLVYLQQKIEDITSMTWTLTKSNPAHGKGPKIPI